jgi:catechol 2,3-dioxygenase-like lactoylglutathione lyase family enzyme
MPQPGAETSTELLAIDHVALRVPDPSEVARFLCDHLGMESSESDDGFTVVGAPAGRSRLFLFEADAPSEPGALQRIVLRVSDLERALSLLPSGLEVDEPEPELAVFQAPHGLELGLTRVLGGGVGYDLDHIVLRVMDPDETTIALAELGFVPRGGGLHVGDKLVRLRPGIRSAGEHELLGHIGVLVDSIEPVKGQALRAGLEFDELTLTPNKLGVYVRGPERIRVEYSERR